MTKLSTIIPPKYIKQSEKLRNIKISKNCDYHYFIDDKYVGVRIGVPKEHNYCNDTIVIPAPTIADIINNSEELFGGNAREFWKKDKNFRQLVISALSGTSYNFEDLTVMAENKIADYIGQKIFKMCQQNKSVEEISEYIIKNIK